MKGCCTLNFVLDGFETGFRLAQRGERFTCVTCGAIFEMRKHWTQISDDPASPPEEPGAPSSSDPQEP